jgi:hypothetical protein
MNVHGSDGIAGLAARLFAPVGKQNGTGVHFTSKAFNTMAQMKEYEKPPVVRR